MSSLAIGTALSKPIPAENVGRRAHVDSVANAVRAAIANAGIERLDDVHFVQVKCPCVTVARAAAAITAGKTPLTSDPNKSMAYARANFEINDIAARFEELFRRFARQSSNSVARPEVEGIVI